MDTGSGWRFRPDATPVTGSEFRPALLFSADAFGSQPQKWDMKATFAQWRLKNHEWNWKRVPLPRAGEKLTLNRETISPTGARVRLVSVAFYDAKHHFAAIENRLADDSDNSQGVALSFEADLNQFGTNKPFDRNELIADFSPNSVPHRGTMSTNDSDAISGQKSSAKVARWTFVYPLKQLVARSFDFNISWNQDYATGRTASFDFPNLPAPDKETTR